MVIPPTASRVAETVAPSSASGTFKSYLEKSKLHENAAVPAAARPERSSSEVAAATVEGLQQAQRRMEQVMSLAASGRSFSPAELLAFQANVYQCSQQIDLAGKVVDKVGGGVRQILQTQL